MSSSKETVLVTGGAGFIGSHIVRRLLQDGYQVRVLDNFATGKHENLEEVRDSVEIIEGDAADFQTAQKAVADADCVFHQAAIPSVPRSVRDPLTSHRANATATLTMLTAARDAGVRRFVYAASSSAYGDAQEKWKVETLPTLPRSPYAVDKLSGENFCRAFNIVYGFEAVALRYFNVFGPRQDPLSEYSAVIPRFISAMLQNRDVTIYGDGEQSRDFTFVENVVQANMQAMTAEGVGGEVLNVACGESYTLNQLVSQLGEILDVRPNVINEAPRVGDVKHSLANIEKAQRLLGYSCRVSFHEGLRQTAAYLKAQQSKATTSLNT
jgi:UDP-glucose 4-epimerase